MSYAIAGKPATREEWLEARRQVITATDISAILGLNQYKSRTDLWLEKHGLAVDKEESGAMWLGRAFEDVCAKWWSERTRLKVSHHGSLVTSPCGRFGATPDYLFSDGQDYEGLLETKTTVLRSAQAIGFDPYQQGTDRVPESYLLQCQWQMFVCGERVCQLALLVLDVRELWVYEIQRHEGLIAKCVAAAEEFLECLKGDMPEITGEHPRDLGTLAELFPDGDGEPIHATEEDEALIARFEMAQADLKRAEANKEGIEAQIKARMGEAPALLFGDGWKQKITWKTQAGRTDWKGLALSFSPTTDQIAASVTAPTRVFRHPFKSGKES